MNPFSSFQMRRMLRRTSMAGLFRNLLVGVVLSASIYAHVHMGFDLLSFKGNEISYEKEPVSRLFPIVITPSGPIGKLVFQDN